VFLDFLALLSFFFGPLFFCVLRLKLDVSIDYDW